MADKEPIWAQPVFGIAQYQCRKCFTLWSQMPGMTACPSCGHHYVDWKNYDEWFKECVKAGGIDGGPGVAVLVR